MTELNRLLDLWENLGERERKVVLSFMTRLYAGQRLHGKLSLDKKKWGYEAIEEALDGCVYLTCMLNDFVDRSVAGIADRAEEEVRASGRLDRI